MQTRSYGARMNWASHPTAEMPTTVPTGRHRRRRTGVLGAIAAASLLLLAALGAMFSPTLLGWPPPSRSAAPPAPSASTSSPSTVSALPGMDALTASPATVAPPPIATSPTGAAPTRKPPAATGIAALEDEVVALTRAERDKRDCAPLVLDDKLRTAARSHSADMARNGYFGHTNPDGQDPGERMTEAGYRTDRGWAENIARGYPTAAAVMTGWMASSGHRANILNCSMRSIGVGVARATDGRLLWTQDFGGR